MTGPSEVDPVVLAGEPGSAAQLEGGDDDLPPVGGDAEPEPASDHAPEAATDDAPEAATDRASTSGEWADADALLEGQPTELGELPPA
jgi:hypothetical protein